MAHSKRDLINDQRRQLSEGVGADPGIEVGATTHGVAEAADKTRHLVGLLHEAGIDIGSFDAGDVVARVDVPPGSRISQGEDGDIVVHNAEQLSVLQDLERLINDTGAVIAMAKATREEDENLYRQDVEWDMVGCGHAERWIDDGGNLGWRVGINFADASAHKFMAYIAGKLAAMGWENVIAEAWGG